MWKAEGGIGGVILKKGIVHLTVFLKTDQINMVLWQFLQKVSTMSLEKCPRCRLYSLKKHTLQ